MTKKKTKRKQKKRAAEAKHSAPQLKRSPKLFRFLLIAFAAVGFLVFSWAYLLFSGEVTAPQTSEISKTKKANTNLRENRTTLPPQRFSGTFRLAYEVAREIPEVLDELYCYCRCQENLGHKNLLSCYVDTHAST